MVRLLSQEEVKDFNRVEHLLSSTVKAQQIKIFRDVTGEMEAIEQEANRLEQGWGERIFQEGSEYIKRQREADARKQQQKRFEAQQQAFIKQVHVGLACVCPALFLSRSTILPMPGSPLAPAACLHQARVVWHACLSARSTSLPMRYSSSPVTLGGKFSSILKGRVYVAFLCVCSQHKRANANALSRRHL